MNINQTNNSISQKQWDTILKVFYQHCKSNNIPSDMPYVGETAITKGSIPKRRQFIHDNYDRVFSPGLRFISTDNDSDGRLYVYNSSEQACAPITFEQGIEIADNFFSNEGYMLSEEIVCNYMMS